MIVRDPDRSDDASLLLLHSRSIELTLALQLELRAIDRESTSHARVGSTCAVSSKLQLFMSLEVGCVQSAIAMYAR